MDPLSNILKTTRARSPFIADIRLGKNISLGIPRVPGIPFHYILSGDCCLVFQTQRVELSLGDFVMLPTRPAYRLETGSGKKRTEIVDFEKRQNLPPNYMQNGMERPLVAEVGGPSPVTRLLSGRVIPMGQEGGPLTLDLPEVMLLRNAKAQLEPWLVAAIDFLTSEGSAPEPGFAAIAERLIELIFLAALRKWLLQATHERGWMRGLTDPTIARALNALHADPGRHWTLQDIASLSGRSRSGFAEHFRSIMQETPFAYLTRWRMHLASIAILQSERSVAEVGASLGYRSSYAFARAFQITFGETPSQYRRSGLIQTQEI